MTPPLGPSTRPTASATVLQVDGGLWQGRCACRWHGLRWLNQHAADRETAEHVAHCGRCVLEGRRYMDVCSCANCQRRRLLGTRIAPPRGCACPTCER